jgi:hypothetical protein
LILCSLELMLYCYFDSGIFWRDHDWLAWFVRDRFGFSVLGCAELEWKEKQMLVEC